MMIKKVEKKSWWGSNGAISKLLGVFDVQATLLTVGIHEPHQSCRKCVFGCLTTSH